MRRVSSLPFLGARILLVTAHPDDESYAFGGMLTENLRHGGENILVCLTDGEKGRSHFRSPITEQQLRKLRRSELRAAAIKLGLVRTILLHVPDGKIIVRQTSATERLQKIVKRVRPEAMISFGSDGI